VYTWGSRLLSRYVSVYFGKRGVTTWYIMQCVNQSQHHHGSALLALLLAYAQCFPTNIKDPCSNCKCMDAAIVALLALPLAYAQWFLANMKSQEASNL